LFRLKKMKYIILTFIICSSIFMSCTKCTKCTEVSDKGKVVAKYNETCGNWRDVAEFENNVHAQALKTSTVSCVKKSKMPFVGDDSKGN
jgi:hypothetical protein